jgi:energy-converting hydrogenase B subunit Q
MSAEMARPDHAAPTVAVRLDFADRPEALTEIVAQVASAGGTLRTLSTVRRWVDDSGAALVEVELEVEGLAEAEVTAILDQLTVLRGCRITKSLDKVFGKRLIVIGGGAQIAQAVLGAVSEADRHNLRGEKISVDTIPLVGEENLAAAVRAVADLDRARALLMAGSIMGGDITRAVQELQAVGIPVISLNMVGSVPDVADLVVTDPVQAGTMAVMGIADTAKFDLARQKGRRY